VGGLGAHRNRLSHRLLTEADVVLGLGTRFEEMETNWKPDSLPSPDACYIQVDTDGGELGRSVRPRIEVVGDAGIVARQVLAVLDNPTGDGNRWLTHPRTVEITAETEALRREVAELADDDSTPLSPVRILRAVRAAFPRTATVAFDIGKITQQIGGAFPFFEVYEARSLIVPSSFYGMGFAGAALPAARVARPDCPAVGLVGDGSFQMIMNVLPAAAEERLPVTWCVMNDRALGSIRDIQEFAKDERFIATEFQVQPDFAEIARACSCYGERVEKPGDIDGALHRAVDANESGVPAVLDFAIARTRLQQTRDHYGFYPQATR
jgi:acetolactate synthase-1/2/3 large subunit